MKIERGKDGPKAQCHASQYVFNQRRNLICVT